MASIFSAPGGWYGSGEAAALFDDRLDANVGLGYARTGFMTYLVFCHRLWAADSAVPVVAGWNCALSAAAIGATYVLEHITIAAVALSLGGVVWNLHDRLVVYEGL